MFEIRKGTQEKYGKCKLCLGNHHQSPVAVRYLIRVKEKEVPICPQCLFECIEDVYKYFIVNFKNNLPKEERGYHG